MSNTRPQIVTLCGSTRFKNEFLEAAKQLTARGVIVLSVGWFGHCETHGIPDDIKASVDELHFRKIDISDWVLVLDVDGYICESTRREIAYSYRHNKPILKLSEMRYDYNNVPHLFLHQL